MSDDLRKLPEGLPIPKNDGAAEHLHDRLFPDLDIECSNGSPVNLRAIAGPLVIYCYPMMAKGAAELPGGWNQLPGARGCTVQSLKYSDWLDVLRDAGAIVYGVSTEPRSRQVDAVKRLGLGHQLLSDSDRRLCRALRLPTFELESHLYLRRVTLGALDGRIERVWYPVFPPGDEIEQVVDWLSGLPRQGGSTPPEPGRVRGDLGAERVR